MKTDTPRTDADTYPASAFGPTTRGNWTKASTSQQLERELATAQAALAAVTAERDELKEYQNAVQSTTCREAEAVKQCKEIMFANQYQSAGENISDLVDVVSDFFESNRKVPDEEYEGADCLADVVAWLYLHRNEARAARDTATERATKAEAELALYAVDPTKPKHGQWQYWHREALDASAERDEAEERADRALIAARDAVQRYAGAVWRSGEEDYAKPVLEQAVAEIAELEAKLATVTAERDALAADWKRLDFMARKVEQINELEYHKAEHVPEGWHVIELVVTTGVFTEMASSREEALRKCIDAAMKAQP
jgi:hypothetical protein